METIYLRMIQQQDDIFHFHSLIPLLVFQLFSDILVGFDSLLLDLLQQHVLVVKILLLDRSLNKKKKIKT